MADREDNKHFKVHADTIWYHERYRTVNVNLSCFSKSDLEAQQNNGENEFYDHELERRKNVDVIDYILIEAGINDNIRIYIDYIRNEWVIEMKVRPNMWIEASRVACKLEGSSAE